MLGVGRTPFSFPVQSLFFEASLREVLVQHSEFEKEVPVFPVLSINDWIYFILFHVISK